MPRRALFAFLAAVVAAPVHATEVNVYSYRQPDLVAPLFEAFTKETGVNVNVVYLKKGMVERLSAEGDRSPADLVFTADLGRLMDVQKAGLTQPVTSDTLRANVPDAFRDPEGHWWGLTARARIVFASVDRVADGDITTYEALADPVWAGRICTRSGTHAYNLALTAAMIARHGEEKTRGWLDGVKANLARRPQGNDRAQVKAIWSGECDISIGNTYYMGLMLQEEEQKPWAASVRIVFPEFDGGGTHVNLSGVAMTKAAPNNENALLLMNFLASPAGQALYAEVNNEYPLAPNTPPSDLVATWGDYTADQTPLAEIAALRAAALRLVEEVNFDE